MTGVKCGNINCKFADPTTKLEDWVNKPCPDCGEIIINQEDFNLLQSMEGMIDSLRTPKFQQFEPLLMDNSDMNLGDLVSMFENMFRQESTERISIEDYNKEGHDAVTRVTNGEFLTHEEVIEVPEKRKKTRRGKKH